MFKFIIDHVFQLIIVIFCVTTLTFFLVRLAPGDPALIMLKANDVAPPAEAVDALREELGLTKSLSEQYIQWMKNVFTGHWGNSFVSGEPVIEELFVKLPATFELAIAGLIVMLAVTFGLGIATSIYEKGIVDRLGRTAALLGSAIPPFLIGFLCIYIFSVQLGWLPSMGRSNWQNIILPAITLGLGLGTMHARVLRVHLLELMKQPFVKASKARGFSNAHILMFQLVKHAFLVIATLTGTNFAFMLGGSIIVESIFSWPGLGRYIIDSINMRDYPVIQGYVIFASILFVVIHTVVDLIYLIVDPRLRVQIGGR